MSRFLVFHTLLVTPGESLQSPCAEVSAKAFLLRPPHLCRLFYLAGDHAALPLIFRLYTMAFPCRARQLLHIQAQGLQHLLTAYARRGAWAALQRAGVPLAAHGPYTAAGVEATLGSPVDVVSRDFSSFRGLVAALERHFSALF